MTSAETRLFRPQISLLQFEGEKKGGGMFELEYIAFVKDKAQVHL